MLWNPKHDLPAETKADPLSLDAFLRWVEKQPADRSYDWFDCGQCLVASYLREAVGVARPSCEHIFSQVFGDNWPYVEIAGTAPHTFGAALDRARALRAAAES